MTFEEYIANPTGVGTAVISYRKMYEDLYHGKWNKIMVRENGKVDYTLYKSKKSYFVHIKIPSETVDKFYYDVVIKLTPKDKNDRNLNKAEARFFSNDPSFNYTFAHAFKEHDMHVKELEKRMAKLAIKKEAVEKNPQNTIGYVKTLYFAYIVMKEKGLFHVVKFEGEAKPFNEMILLSKVKDTDEMLIEREKAGAKQAKANAKEKATNKVTVTNKDIINPEVKNNKFVRTARVIGGVKTTKTVKTVKKSKGR